MMNTKIAWEILKETYFEWNEDNAMHQSAALAYYTAVSIIPLIIIVIAIAGLVFGYDVARDQVVAQIRGLIGPRGADAVNTMIEECQPLWRRHHSHHRRRGYLDSGVYWGLHPASLCAKPDMGH